MHCEVTIGGKPFQVDVFQTADRRWLAKGSFRHIDLTAEGRSEERALSAWRNAAAYRAQPRPAH